MIEMSFVMLLMGVFILIALPNVARGLRPERTPFEELSLWFEIIHERSVFRREVILVEIDPEQGVLRAVSPVPVDKQTDESGQETAVVDLPEIDDPFFPARLELPEGYRFDDVQAGDGRRYDREKYFQVFYPWGWTDPLTIHLYDPARKIHTGFVRAPTGHISWQEGYRERFIDQTDEVGG